MASSAFVDLSTFVNELGYACSTETQPLVVGQAIATSVPFDMVVERVYASLSVAPTGSSVQIDVEIGGVSIFPTGNLTIGIGAETAETNVFVGGNTFDIAKDDILTIDINTVDIGTATGLKVYLMGHRDI